MSNQPSSIRIAAQLLLAVVMVYVAYVLFSPFLLPLLTAAVIVLIMRPVYGQIHEKLNSPVLASALTIILILLVIIVPLSVLSILLLRETAAVSGAISHSSFHVEGLQNSLNHLFARFGYQNLPAIDFKGYALRSLSSIAQHSTTYLGGVFGVLGDLVLVLFGTFYLLQSLPKARAYLISISPLSHQDSDALIRRVQEVVQATVRGYLIIVVLEGIVFTIGCLVFGISAPVLVGILFGLASLIPVIGTGIVWVPVVIFSFLTGHTVAAIGIAAWALLQAAIVDNIIAPKLLERRAKLHPFLALLGVLGGVSYFGLLGFILGPTIMALGIVGLEMLARAWNE